MGQFIENGMSAGIPFPCRLQFLLSRLFRYYDKYSMNKRIIAFFALIMICMPCLCKDDNILTFLEIPIDGYKHSFERELKWKGFSYNNSKKCYEGQFNGMSSFVYVSSYHNRVDRILVLFPDIEENYLRIQFNSLLTQLQNNDKYLSSTNNEEIPADEDISYQISVNHKRYIASFNYFGTGKIPMIADFLSECRDIYTSEQMEYLKALIPNSNKASEPITFKICLQNLVEEMYSLIDQEENEGIKECKENIFKIHLAQLALKIEPLVDGNVWFEIVENDGDYAIGLFYDNLHNRPHGEDL